MGNDLRHKGLLLDEADFALPRDCDMETLVKAVEDFLEAEFRNEFDHPFLEIVGVVSEGFDQTTACRCDRAKAVWVKPHRGFQDIFLGIASELGIPEPLAVDALRTASTEGVEMYLKDRIREHLDFNSYEDAHKLIEYLPDLRSSDLPGVKGPGEFDTRGKDLIVDYRINNYGLGRRILAEIVFDWGQ